MITKQSIRKDWNLIESMIDYNSTILDIGCGKGFMLYDFKKANPKFSIEGIDISKYAVENAKPEVKEFLKVGNAEKLNYQDNTFDLVVSITTVHNLDLIECKKAIMEIERVSCKHKFLTVDAYSNDKEKEMMYSWNLIVELFVIPELDSGLDFHSRS